MCSEACRLASPAPRGSIDTTTFRGAPACAAGGARASPRADAFAPFQKFEQFLLEAVRTLPQRGLWEAWCTSVHSVAKPRVLSAVRDCLRLVAGGSQACKFCPTLDGALVSWGGLLCGLAVFCSGTGPAPKTGKRSQRGYSGARGAPRGRFRCCHRGRFDPAYDTKQ